MPPNDEGIKLRAARVQASNTMKTASDTLNDKELMGQSGASLNAKDVTSAASASVDDGRPLFVHQDGDVVLRDGSTVRVRVMRAADEPGLLALLQSLSEESRWLRFYSSASGSALATEARREATLDQPCLLCSSR